MLILEVLIDLGAGIALLIWATGFVKANLGLAFGSRLKTAVSHATSSRLIACATGGWAAFLLQSSSATALLVTTFAAQRLVTAAPGLALMLGADLGSSLVPLIFLLKTTLLSHALLVTGAALSTLPRRRDMRACGGILLGLGLILVSLELIVSAVEHGAGAASISPMLGDLAPRVGFAFGAGLLLAWVAHSSIATILLCVSLAASSVLSSDTAFAAILGANAGSGLVPMAAGWAAGREAQLILVGNFLLRLIGACAGLLILTLSPNIQEWIATQGSSQLLFLHLGFNFLLVMSCLPLTHSLAYLAGRIIPGPGTVQSHQSIANPSYGASPDQTLRNAEQITLSLADTVETMLSEALVVLRHHDIERCDRLTSLDDEIDRKHGDIKLQLTRLMQQPLNPAQIRKCYELLHFATHLEHAGDIIDHGLLKHAAKRMHNGVDFSQQGWEDIEELHGQATEQLRRVRTLLTAPDHALAHSLIAEKDRFRTYEREATQRHFDRLRRGCTITLQTSDIDLDILRDLKRIMAHFSSPALPILESTGALRSTRLRNRSSIDGRG